MFEKSKRTAPYIATIGFVILGGMVVNNNCQAKTYPACACGPSWMEHICVPDDLNHEQLVNFCKEEGKIRNKNENSCPLEIGTIGCGTRNKQRWG